MIYLCGGYRIDADRFELSHDGRALHVEPQVLELLILLIEKRERVVSRDELLATIWKGRVVSDTTLSSRVKSARQVLGDDGRRQAFIKTIHGRGFRFVGEVRDETSPANGRAAPPVTRYARSGEIHVAYQQFGSGPVNLILAPGFVSHIDNYWDSPQVSRWLGRLGTLARVAVFDKRGTGLSDRVDALPGMDERLDDLRAVMDAVGFERAFVMGISEGGSLAAVFAAHHPARCDGLILYGSFAQFKHWFADDAALQVLIDYVERDWGSGKSLPLFAPSVGGDPDFTRWWGQFERLGATPGAAIALMRMNSRIDITDVLPSIQVPTLVVHAADDVLIDIAAGHQLAAQIPGAQYVEIPGADHLPWAGTNPDAIVDAVEGFFKDPGTRTPTGRVLATILCLRSGSDIDLEAMRAELQLQRVSRVWATPQGAAATFDGPARAIEGALALSRALRGRGVPHRIGLHTGEVGEDGGVPAGMALTIANDVAEHAGQNEILISRTVSDLIAGADVSLTDRGTFSLPSIGRRWRLFLVDV